jgi:thiol-disulfide isomerase/thioredoxin
MSGTRLLNMTKFTVFILVVVSAVSWAQANPAADAPFPPFEQWKKAVLANDADSLRALYSTNPPAQVRVKTVKSGAETDIGFWLALKPSAMETEMVRNEPRHGHISYIFRAVFLANGQTMTVTEDQSWQQQGDQWRIISVELTPDPRLEQPADMKKDIYPAGVDARVEIREAEEKAAKEQKRVLLVFGANWCFDCHVLDRAFHRPDFASVMSHYEVIHVDIGPDGKKNNDLAKQFDVPLEKGVPALAVLDNTGKLLVSQKNGEFEDARAMAPEVILVFLNKWKAE